MTKNWKNSQIWREISVFWVCLTSGPTGSAEWVYLTFLFRIPKFHISAFQNHLQTKFYFKFLSVRAVSKNTVLVGWPCRNCTIIDFREFFPTYTFIESMAFYFLITNLAILWPQADFIAYWTLHYHFPLLLSRNLFEITPGKDLLVYLILIFLPPAQF